MPAHISSPSVHDTAKILIDRPQEHSLSHYRIIRLIGYDGSELTIAVHGNRPIEAEIVTEDCEP